MLLNLIKNDVDIKDKYLRKAKDRLIPNNNNRKDRYINKSRFQRKALGKNVYWTFRGVSKTALLFLFYFSKKYWLYVL